jgi:hypothetical protein
MKKLILLCLLISIGYSVVQAQGLRLNGYINYTFDDRFDTYYTNTSYIEGKILGGMQWGVGLEYMVAPDYGIELSYYRMDTQVPIRYWDSSPIIPGEKSRTLEAALNYIMVGGTRYLPVNEKLEGFGGLMVGMAIYENKEPIATEPTGTTKFAWGIRLGANIWITEKVGLKLQGHLLSAVQAFGGGFYFGTGGSGVGVNTYSTFLQFSLGGGLVIKLGEG